MSSASKQEPSRAGQFTPDHPPMAPLSLNKDESSFVKAAQSGQVISPPLPFTLHFGHQPTRSRSLSAEKERSESALAITAALSPHCAVLGVG